MNDALRKAVLAMANSPIRNYIAPGLSSWLIGGPGHGKIRLFSSDRQTHDWITPHSHRFDFTCLVLRGTVTNTLFQPDEGPHADRYCVGTLRRRSTHMGDYEYIPGDAASYWVELPQVYREGDTYSMRSEEVHSIQFSRDALVLFFEGPETRDDSLVLEPWSDGRRVPTFGTAPWMFERDTP